MGKDRLCQVNRLIRFQGPVMSFFDDLRSNHLDMIVKAPSKSFALTTPQYFDSINKKAPVLLAHEILQAEGSSRWLRNTGVYCLFIHFKQRGT
jgi:hypothetical protein